MMINSVVLAVCALTATGIGVRPSVLCTEVEIVAATGLLSKRRGDKND